MKHTPLARNVQRRLRKLRQDKKITQAVLAKRTGISMYYVQRLEGKHPQNPSLLVLEKLAKAFDTTVWELVKFDEDESDQAVRRR